MSKKYYDKISKEEFHSSIPFTCNVGATLLQKMGWSEGKGLGKDEIGIQHCIQIKKKSDNLGLGAKPTKESSQDWNDWWKDTYNDLANKLSTTIDDCRYQDLDTDNFSTDNENDVKIQENEKYNKINKVKKKKKEKKKKKKSKNKKE